MIECEFHLSNNVFINCRLNLDGTVHMQVDKALIHLWRNHRIKIPAHTRVSVRNDGMIHDRIDEWVLTAGTKKPKCICKGFYKPEICPIHGLNGWDK